MNILKLILKAPAIILYVISIIIVLIFIFIAHSLVKVI